MDILNGVGNLCYSSAASVGNFGLNVSHAVFGNIVGYTEGSSTRIRQGGSSISSFVNQLWYGQGSCLDNPIERKHKDIIMSWSRAGSNFVRLAGVSGAVAVGLGAYGAHVLSPSKTTPELKQVFDTGNQIHLIHSVALLAVPLTRRPALAGSLFTIGMLLFSGSCYYHALTGDKSIRWITPYGGIMLIAGWLIIAI